MEAVLSPGGGGASVIRRFASLEALPGDYLPLLERYVGHLLVEGMMQGREDVEFLRKYLGRRGTRLAAIQDKLDGEPVVPDEAVAFLRTRRQLGKFFEKDQVDIVRSILDRALAEGATVKQTMDALQAALPDAIGRARAENIARTEATMAYNQGRLASFRDSDGFVAAVEFMAITDARTTAICRERDGLVLALDDPDLPSCTPPLHFMCRSILSPVSPFELEDLGGDEYLAGMKERLQKATPPLEGFGVEQGPDERPPGQPPVVRQPSDPPLSPRPQPVGAIQADTLPEIDGGVGSGSQLPSNGDARQPRIMLPHPKPLQLLMDEGVTAADPFVRAITQEIDLAPHRLLRLLEEGGYRVVFTTRRIWQLEEFRDAEFSSRVRLFFRTMDAAAAATASEEAKFRLIAFRPKALTVEHRSKSVAFHELGHGLDDLLGLSALPEVVNAWKAEASKLGPPFTDSTREFVAEAAARFYYPGEGLILQSATPQIHGIIQEQDGVLGERFGLLMAPENSENFYSGPEGAAGYVPTSDTITAMLRLDGEGMLADIYRDGTILVRESRSKRIGPITWCADRLVEMEPTKASKLRAFLRSHGFNLPHVMS